jgi:ribulose-bisphosphate carboxylase large chain
MFFDDFDDSQLATRLSGKRFSVVYRLSGNEKTAMEKAGDICAEQSVEFPVDLLPPGTIPEKIVGNIEQFDRESESVWLATISFAEEIAAGEWTQFLNVVFGNISIKQGIQVAGIESGDALSGLFPGPQFGIAGIRKIIDVPVRPPLFTALKPMGLSAPNLARLAERFVEGGIDIIKDDHGLSDQVFAPFEDRVARCADAVREANERFGHHSIYVPNITAPGERTFDRATCAKEYGAGGLLLSPGLVGLDTLRHLASINIGLPIFAHPAFIGSYVMSREQGIDCGVLFGTLMRLAGADATIFPNYGGRFPLSVDDCVGIVHASRKPMKNLLPIFPTPAGGMELKNIREMLNRYGNDTLVLVGSGLFRNGDDLIDNCRRFLDITNASISQNTDRSLP